MSGLLVLLSCFVERSALNANSVDPDQTPRSAASDLDLHCLPMSHLWDARHKWVKQTVRMHKLFGVFAGAHLRGYVFRPFGSGEVNSDRNTICGYFHCSPFQPCHVKTFLQAYAIYIPCRLSEHTCSCEATMLNLFTPVWKGFYSTKKEFAPLKSKTLFRRNLV